ncbi:MAG: DUF3631 domain-containing protein [Deltaproteobacteria bacterium]|nr:DUF3631 domain-containing protein [Deltaproteobacteria bacterium]
MIDQIETATKILDEMDDSPAGRAQNEGLEHQKWRAELDAEIRRLAVLDEPDYARQRKKVSKPLSISVGKLDKWVGAERHSIAGEDARGGKEIEFRKMEPWPELVNGASLLSDLAEVITRLAILPRHAPEALALWVLFSHTFDAHEYSPRLLLSSPEKRCGKRRVIEILTELVSRPLAVSNLTPATLFRSIQTWRPTLLVDEADSFAKDNETLRGLINSGHSRKIAFVPRCVGDDFEPRLFSTWAPLVIAGIGHLPDTIEDRSIIIQMRRRRKDEPIARLNRDVKANLSILARKCLRWAADSLATIKDSEPLSPRGLDDRAENNWCPLLAVAEAAGADWPLRARDAAIALSTSSERDADTNGTMILADIRDLFEEKGERILSRDLCSALAALETQPWGEYGRSLKPITPNQLARLLRLFGVQPKTIRTETERGKGYDFKDFEDTFARYLPCGKRDSVTTFGNQGETDCSTP